MNNNHTICLLNDSFPPVIDGVANVVVNYGTNIQKEHGNAVVVTPEVPGADDSAYNFRVIRYPSIDTRKMFGCYLYNFGERKLATAKAVRWQLDFYREKILAGEAEGVVFHTNTMADLDYESYDAALEWMAIHGDEEVGEPIPTFVNH